MTHSPPPLTPLAGGYSGETFLATAEGLGIAGMDLGPGSDRVVVRIYGDRSAPRGPRAVEIDAALLRLMRGIVPVPRVLEARRAQGDLPALLVTEHLSGERGDLLLPRLDDHGLAAAGREIGGVLDRIRHVPTLAFGRFVDGDLTIGPFGDVEAGLVAYLEGVRERLYTWDDGEWAALLAVAETADDLAAEPERTCLVHSDLNPKNLLLDPDTLAVTGVLDWEFAHSGSPYADLGNLTRFDRHPYFVAAVLTRLGLADPAATAGDALTRARAADLWSLVGLSETHHRRLRSRGPDHDVARRADALLRAIAVAGDLHARPESDAHRDR